MSPSNDRRHPLAAFTRTVGVAVATAGLLFTSAASVAAAGATGTGGHAQSNVAVDQSGCGLIPLDVELIVDRSGSMGDNVSNGHTRLYWAQHAADQLVDSLDANGGVGSGEHHRVGVSSFHNASGTVNLALGGATASAARTAINGLTSSGNTPLAQGMAAGAGDMSTHGRDTDFGLAVQHVIIILSDGRPWPDSAPARPNAGQIGTFRGSADSIYSIAIGQGGTQRHPQRGRPRAHGLAGQAREPATLQRGRAPATSRRSSATSSRTSPASPASRSTRRPIRPSSRPAAAPSPTATRSATSATSR